MASRFPIVVDVANNWFSELPVGDDLDIGNGNIVNLQYLVVNNSITSNYYFGDGGLLSNIDHTRLSNGNSNIVVYDDIITVSANGSPNMVTFDSNGMTINANLNSTLYINANYYLGDGGLLSNLKASEIVNGNSNIRVYASNNIVFSVNGNANIITMTTDTMNVNVDANFAGNVTANNINVSGHVTANGNITVANGFYFIGDGSQLTNIDRTYLANGNSNINVISNGNITMSSRGVANVFLVSNTGANVTGRLNVTGNVQAANVNASLVFASFFQGDGGLLSNVNVVRIENGNSNITVVPNANINFSVAGTANVVVIGPNGNMTVNGNMTTNTAVKSNLFTTSNGNITISAASGNNSILLQPTGTGVVDANLALVSNVATPVSASDAATKSYVDSVASGLNVHTPCRAATTTTLAAITGGTVTYNNGTNGVGATITLSVALTSIDGVALAIGDRILVKDQTTTAHNGIYQLTSATVLTRVTDLDSSTEIDGGDFVFVQEGTIYNNTGWVETERVTTMGTDPILWKQFSGVGTYVAGVGITIESNVIGLANTTVTAGTYGNGEYSTTFTVDQQGRLTAAGQRQITANANALLGNRLANNVIYSNLTTLGTVSNLNVTGNTVTNYLVSNYTIQADSGSFTGNLTAANFSGANTITANFISATIHANSGSQPNIASLGNLTELRVNGISTFNSIANVRIPGGAYGQIIMANANGNLQWTNSVEGGNTAIQYNNNGFIGGANSFTYNKTTDTVTLPNITVNNITTISNISNLRIPGGNVGQRIVTNGNGVFVWTNALGGANTHVQYNAGNGEIGGSNVFAFDNTTNTVTVANSLIVSNSIHGTLSANSNNQSNITRVGTLTELTVEGVSNLGVISNVFIYGGNVGQVLTTDGYGNLSWTTPPTPTYQTFPGNNVGNSLVPKTGWSLVTNAYNATWVDMSTLFPTDANVGGAAFTQIGNEVYIAGGYGGTMRSGVFKYNMSTNTWTTLGNMPSPVYFSCFTGDGENLWVFGGFNSITNIATNNLYKYNVAANTWTLITDASGSVPSARYAGGMVYDGNGNIYLLGGTVGITANTNLTAEVYKYNIATNTWTQLANMAYVRREFMPIYYDYKIYIGFGQSSAGTASDNLFIYDVLTQTTTLNQLSPATGQYGTSAILIDDAGRYGTYRYPRIYYMGSNNNFMYYYEINTGMWGDVPFTLTDNRRENCAVGVYDNKIYIIGGWNSSYGGVSKISRYAYEDQSKYVNSNNWIVTTNSAFGAGATTNPSAFWSGVALLSGNETNTEQNSWATYFNDCGVIDIAFPEDHYVTGVGFNPRQLTGSDSWYVTTSNSDIYSGRAILLVSADGGKTVSFAGETVINIGIFKNYVQSILSHLRVNWIRLQLTQGLTNAGLVSLRVYGKKAT